MEYKIENDNLKVIISDMGGALISVKDAFGSEILWQKDVEIWDKPDQNLFPFIGRMYNQKYRYEGVLYKSSLHGFLQQSKMELISRSSTYVILKLKSNLETKKIYPFDFDVQLEHRIFKKELLTHYTIRNIDQKEIFFAIGGHPSFKVPFEGVQSVFEDYYLEFTKNSRPIQICISDNCLVSGKSQMYPLVNGRLDLSHNLFYRDALILKDIGERLFLKNKRTFHKIEFKTVNMDYLAIWSKDSDSAHYLCIEPWTSLPGEDGKIIELSEKKDLIQLMPGQSFTCSWSMKL